MAIRKTDGRRWVEMEFLVPGTPEQVWDAIATGRGMSAWFTPTTVDERVGGAIEFDFGDCTVSPAVITEWTPPERLGYEERVPGAARRQRFRGHPAPRRHGAGGQARMMVSLYLYGDEAADTAAAEAPKWRSWMAQLVDADPATT